MVLLGNCTRPEDWDIFAPELKIVSVQKNADGFIESYSIKAANLIVGKYYAINCTIQGERDGILVYQDFINETFYADFSTNEWKFSSLGSYKMYDLKLSIAKIEPWGN